MGSLNKVMIVGRLGKDPEIRYTQSGTSVCTFSMATDLKWTDKAGVKQEKTEWHRVKAWSKLADLAAQFLAKGRQAYVEGRLETREWTDKDGVKRYTTEIVADQIVFLDGKRDGAPRDAGASLPASQPAEHDGIPF